MSAFAKEIFDGTTATQFHGLLIVFWVVNFWVNKNRQMNFKIISNQIDFYRRHKKKTVYWQSVLVKRLTEDLNDWLLSKRIADITVISHHPRMMC
jgi:hypothetical protein